MSAPIIMLVVVTFFQGIREPEVTFAEYDGPGKMTGCNREAAAKSEAMHFLEPKPTIDGKRVRTVLYSCELKFEETDENFAKQFKWWAG